MSEQTLRIGTNTLLTFGASAFLAMVHISNISADELPRDLVLQCQGNTKLTITRGNETDVQKDRFDLALRLKDGSLSNVDYDFLEGKNCALVHGIIRCELNTTTYKSDMRSKEHRTVAINRTTGEMNLTLESQTFDGTNTTSEPTMTIRSLRTGVCRFAGSR